MPDPTKGRHIVHAVDLPFSEQKILRGERTGDAPAGEPPREMAAKSDSHATSPDARADRAAVKKSAAPGAPARNFAEAGATPDQKMRGNPAGGADQKSAAAPGGKLSQKNPAAPAENFQKNSAVPGAPAQKNPRAARQNAIGCAVIAGALLIFAILILVVMGGQKSLQIPADPAGSAPAATAPAGETGTPAALAGIRDAFLTKKSADSAAKSGADPWGIAGALALVLALLVGIGAAVARFSPGGESEKRSGTVRTTAGAAVGIALLGAISFGISATLRDRAPPVPVQIIQTAPVDLVGSAPFLVKFSAPALENSARFFAWDFGDGEKGSGPRVEHIFEKIGDFQVVLTATDKSSGAEKTATRTVSIGNILPEIRVKVVPESGPAPLFVRFDASASRDKNGEILGWAWDFGDGEKIPGGATAEHTFAEPGEISVRVFATDNNGETAEKIIPVTVAATGRPVPKILTSPEKLETIPPLVVRFDAGESTDDRGIRGYEWDFDDGTPRENGQTATHTFEKSGIYEVRLTVTDTDGNHASTGVTVALRAENSPPLAKISATPTAGEPPLRVVFDGGESADLDGSVTKYFWDFGDGETAEGQRATHEFAAVGRFPVRLTVEDDRGKRAETTVEIVAAAGDPQSPQVSLRTDPDPPAITVGDSIRFDAGQSFDPDGRIISYEWDFGDGKKRLGGAIMTREFAKVGIFTVTVRAIDDTGRAGSATLPVAVNNPEPVARATAAPDSGVAPLRVAFDAGLSEGNLTGFLWDFGDGATSSEKSPEHLFLEPGVYRVSLRVSDAAGVSDSTVAEVRVR